MIAKVKRLDSLTLAKGLLVLVLAVLAVYLLFFAR
jgi:hypothetical protein